MMPFLCLLLKGQSQEELRLTVFTVPLADGASTQLSELLGLFDHGPY